MGRLTKEQLQDIKYLNLNTHSHFSIPLGVGSIKAHMKRAAECGFTGFSITDSQVMAGALEVYKLSKDKDFLAKTLKKESFPVVLGVELNIIDDLSRKDKVNKYFSITAYAKNLEGYKNLVTLTSLASRDDHFYVKPRISLPELVEMSEGLVITSGNMNGMISQSILRETGQEDTLIEIFKEHFGDNFLLEIHFYSQQMQWERESKSYKDSGVDPQKTVNLKLIELARRHKVKCVLTQNSFMPYKKNHLQQNIMIGNSPQFKDGWHFHHSLYTMNIEEMYQEVQKQAPYISDEQFVEWCNNTQIVLEKCKDLKLSFTPKLPDIQYQESIVNKDPKWDEEFYKVKEALKADGHGLLEIFEASEEDIALKTSLKIMMRNAKIDFNNQVHRDRLLVELKVIQRNGVIGLCDYFLLLEDVTHFIRENGLLRGFGRGSGAGSLVAYALDITDCNPIDFDLLFERFLTKERIGKLNFEIPGFDFKELSKDE